MKIVVPMAGSGRRFNDYLSLKPLIIVEGKPMIEHAVGFIDPVDEHEFIFICNEKHFHNTDMHEVLNRIPIARKTILSIPDHSKGPSFSNLFAFNELADEDEVLVTYCDTIQVLDFDKFLQRIRKEKPDGAIFTFKGFHPASLGETYYGYLRVDPEGYMEELREKLSFTNARMEEPASSGVYYFSRAELFKRYTREILSDSRHAVNGEYYASLPFNLMVRDGFKVLSYPVEKFISLGIPRDYELYKFWSEYFMDLATNSLSFNNVNFKMTSLFPLAGGERDFQALGMDELNFLIPIDKKPFIDKTLLSYPQSLRNVFVVLDEYHNEFNLSILPKSYQFNSEVISLESKLGGNAETLLSVRGHVPNDMPVCVSGCTYFIKYDSRRLAHLLEDIQVDVVLFSFSHHECLLRNPSNFHYAKVRDLVVVTEVVAKTPVSDRPYLDQALTGTAIYRCPDDLFSSLEEYLSGGQHPNAFFLDAVNLLLSQQKKVVIFEVDMFVPVRTVDDYRELVYWQEYFCDSSHHPFSKRKDLH